MHDPGRPHRILLYDAWLEILPLPTIPSDNLPLRQHPFFHLLNRHTVPGNGYDKLKSAGRPPTGQSLDPVSSAYPRPADFSRWSLYYQPDKRSVSDNQNPAVFCGWQKLFSRKFLFFSPAFWTLFVSESRPHSDFPAALAVALPPFHFPQWSALPVRFPLLPDSHNTPGFPPVIHTTAAARFVQLPDTWKPSHPGIYSEFLPPAPPVPPAHKD